MTDRTGDILSLLRTPSVDFNRQSEKYWGCSFEKSGENTFNVIAASRYYIVKINNIECSPRERYFDFFDNTWKSSNEHPYSFKELCDVVEKLRTRGDGAVVVSINNMVNWLGQFPKKILESSRIITSPGLLNEDQIVLKFYDEDGKKRSTIDKIGTFEVIDESDIPPQFIKPGQTYKCKVVSIEDKIKVVALEPFGKARFGIKFSKRAFDPQDMESYNRLEKLVTPDSLEYGVNPANVMFATNAIESPQQDWFVKPTHLNTQMFYCLLKCLLLGTSKLAHIQFVDNPNAPIYMHTTTDKPNGCWVEAVMATKNPFFGLQRC